MLSSLSQQLLQSGTTINIAGLRGSSPALISALSTSGPCCCILPDEHLSSIFEQDLRLFTDTRILVYPSYEVPPYTPLSPDQQTTAARLSTLYCLLEKQKQFFLITSIEALMRRVLPGKTISGSAELIIAGEECDQEQLAAALIRAGYEKVALVQRIGDFSIRGGIIDIFPPPFPLDHGSIQDGPVRLDFFGDTVDSLRVFNPLSQRSEKELAEMTVLPVSDILLPQRNSPAQNRILKNFRNAAVTHHWDRFQTELIYDHIVHNRRFAGMEFFLPLFSPDPDKTTTSAFDFLPQDTRLVIVDPESCRQTVQLISERIEANYLEALKNSSPALPPSDLFLNQSQIQDRITSYSRLLCSDFSEESTQSISITTTNHRLLKQDIGAQRRKRGLIAPLADQIALWQGQGDTVIICCRSNRHTRNLAELLDKHGQSIALLEAPLNLLRETQETDSLFLCNHPLQEGFSLPEHQLHFLSESELFGEMRLGSHKKGQHRKGEPSDSPNSKMGTWLK